MVKIWGINYTTWAGEHVMSFFAVDPVIKGEYILKAENSEVMQSTCRLDKNGTEIYEGDILEEDDLKWSRFIVKWDDKWCKFKLCHEGLIGSVVQFPEWNRGIMMKVIGNVHENPELLIPKTADNG